MKIKALLIGILVIMSGCIGSNNTETKNKINHVDYESYPYAVFAGGCFWCMEAAFEPVDGVLESISGYTGGITKNPTYEQVSAGKTGHYEAVKVYYDPSKISYEKLLDVFWMWIDPTDDGGQFTDKGSQYKTAIFYETITEKIAAEKSRKTKGQELNATIATKILKVDKFFIAEEYHQDYYLKQKSNFEQYEISSGRKKYVDNNMEKQKSESKQADIQYEVTMLNATEPAFDNEYWNNYEDGIYVDLVTGEPLFSSKDKYDSGTGWPSFTKAIDTDSIILKKNKKLLSTKTEVRSSSSHLGHVFNDGPTGLRYCINSAALRFIPKKDLEKEGYGKYLKIFEDPTKN